MQKSLAAAIASICFMAPAVAAAPHIVSQKTFATIAAEFSGERAEQLDRRIVEYHRIQGSPMMASVAEEVIVPALKAAGVETAVERFPSDGTTTYQTYVSPIGWTMRAGELWIEGDDPVRLCRYSDVPMCVSTYSKGGDWRGELVDVGNGTRESDYAGRDVRGKVVLASGYARDVARLAVLKFGALGTVIYPSPDDRPDHPDMVRYNGLWTRASDVERASGSFQISANQYALLRERMASGPVRVHGTIDADLGPGSLTLVHAWIRGASPEEVVVTAHLDHPKWSANDNASGSAALVEMIRTLRVLIDGGKLQKPRRTIHLIWVPEYFGTVAWLTAHPEARACREFDDPRPFSVRGDPASGRAVETPCIVANINMDMVGEDTVKTNGRFYMTRAPLSVDSFLDALLPDLLIQTREANLFAPTGTRNFWPAEMSDYYQGSDHDLLLGIGVPSTMFGHDPDWTHHTSADTPDKTDPSEFLRVGVLAANAVWWIASADEMAWKGLAPAVTAERLRRDSAIAARTARLGDDRLTAIARRRLEADLADSPRADAPPAGGPRRATIPPVFSELLAAAKGEDREWLDRQTASLPNFDLALFETVNFMDGKRSVAEIADLLTLELGQKFDRGWVEHAVQTLGRQGLIR